MYAVAPKQTFANAISMSAKCHWRTLRLWFQMTVGCQLRHSRTTSFILLDRWTWHRPVRAEHTAIARLWFKPLATSLAVIEKLAGIGWHLLSCLMPALRTGDCAVFDHDTALMLHVVHFHRATLSAYASHIIFNLHRARVFKDECPFDMLSFA
jgi:hypothetical protein